MLDVMQRVLELYGNSECLTLVRFFGQPFEAQWLVALEK
jgi:hypothetical protein